MSWLQLPSCLNDIYLTIAWIACHMDTNVPITLCSDVGEGYKICVYFPFYLSVPVMLQLKYPSNAHNKTIHKLLAVES